MENAEREVVEEKTFWKTCVDPVPGRPKLVVWNRLENPDSTSFQNFRESVNDAWKLQEGSEEANEKMCKELKTGDSCAVSFVSSTSRNVPESDSPQSTIEVESKIPNAHHFDSFIHTHTKSHNSIHRTKIKPESGNEKKMSTKISRFKALLETSLVCLESLRLSSWSGVPAEVRPTVWRLLAGYLPPSEALRDSTLQDKRRHYWSLVGEYTVPKRDKALEKTFRQIHIDIPRMSSQTALFQQNTVREMFERILFVWAVRHPASGYVQGINDLVTPFYIVFLQEFLSPFEDYRTFEVDKLPKRQRDIVEADSFWCFSKFLEGVQDNYIFANIGIQRTVRQLMELVRRIDPPLHRHLEAREIDYLQFSFRWMNNLLTRELPLHCSVRLWDTYLAESSDLAPFLLYVYVAFLLHWREELLLEKDFQGLMFKLQHLPTQNWVDSDIDALVAEAFRLKFTFADSPNHLH